jgi:hypothetical protein
MENSHIGPWLHAIVYMYINSCLYISILLPWKIVCTNGD